MLWWTLFFVTIVLVAIVVSFSSVLSWVREERPVIRVDQLQTGDIVATTPANVGRYLFSLADIQGGHLTLAVRDDNTNEVKLLEITGYRDNPEAKAKPAIRSIADRLEFPDYDSFATVWRHEGERIPSSKIDDYLALVKDCSFNYRFLGEHVKQRFIGIDRPLDRNKLCCSELTYFALVYCGVLKYDQYDMNDSFRILMKLPTHSRPYDLTW
jgi:hypothetical protein